MSSKFEPRYVAPTLESITIRGKYRIPLTDFKDVSTYLQSALKDWMAISILGDSIKFLKISVSKKGNWDEELRARRVGTPFDFSVIVIERYADGMLIEVHCLPAMYYRIVKFHETAFTENQVQEALLECGLFVKQVMSGLKGKEVEPVSVYPIIQRTEIKERLLNLGLEEIVATLDRAEEHIVQNDFLESLKSSRTAFEKMIDWQMTKRGLDKTNSYQNDLERLKSKGYLDKDTTELLKSYYSCLSVIGVHEKGAKPGLFEARMGYGITLIMLDYFANKLP